jgi:hypothetical protein
MKYISLLLERIISFLFIRPIVYTICAFGRLIDKLFGKGK